MRHSQLRIRLRHHFEQLASKTGRLVLFFALLNVALFGSILGTAVFFGVLQTPEMSIFAHFRIGVETTIEVVASLSDRQSTFMALLMFTSLCMGAITHWLYHQIVKHAGVVITRMRRSGLNL